MGFYDTPGYARDVTIAGGYAFVADGNQGLRIIDISGPSRPVEIGAIGARGTTLGVAVSGTNAYIADYSRGLRVIDVSNPARPLESVQLPYSAFMQYANGVAVLSPNVYVAGWDGGLVIARP